MKSVQYRRNAVRRGTAMIWSFAGLGAMLVAASLALDWGRVTLVRSQMQGASDAAARAAALSLAPGRNTPAHLDLAVSRARQVMAKTEIGGRTLGSDAITIEFGKWNAPAAGFNVLSGTARSGADAVRVRIADTTQLMLTSYFSRSDFSQTTGATAQVTMSPAAAGVVALDSVNLNSAALCIDSYDSRAGAYSESNRGADVIVSSNGNWNLQNHARIDGEAHYWGTNLPVGGRISGQRRPMPEKLQFTPSIVPPGAKQMGHYNGDSDLVLAAGDYHFLSFNLTGNRKVVAQGKVRLFVSGNVNLGGNTVVNSGKPEDLEIHTTTASGVNLDFKGTTQIYAIIYAPNSPVNINGTGDLFGSVIGKSLSMAGNARIHYDGAIALGKPGRVRLME